MTEVRSKRIVVTGVNGFVGKHLARELHENGLSVVGIGREEVVDPEIALVVSEYHTANLTDEWPRIDDVDCIIHLAGLAAVGPSFDKPQEYIEINSIMITRLAEYYLKLNQKPRIVIASSGAVYKATQPMPLSEDSALSFTSPYIVSKVLIENQCAYYRSRGLDCLIVRPFNHIGPGQLEGFLVPDVVAQLRNGKTIKVGNITTKRDYTDVRDIARAYRLLATAETLKHTTYNACSGISRSGEDIVQKLKELSGNSDAEVVIDKSKIRPTDATDIYGDASRLTTDTGWKPEIPFEKTLSDCLKISS